MAAPAKPGWLPFKPTAITRTRTAPSRTEPEPKGKRIATPPPPLPEVSAASPVRGRLHRRDSSLITTTIIIDDDSVADERGSPSSGQRVLVDLDNATPDVGDGNGDGNIDDDSDGYVNIFSRPRQVGTPFFTDMARERNDGEKGHRGATLPPDDQHIVKNTEHHAATTDDDHDRKDDKDWTPTTNSRAKRRRTLDDDDYDDNNDNDDVGRRNDGECKEANISLISPSTPPPPAKARRTLSMAAADAGDTSTTPETPPPIVSLSPTTIDSPPGSPASVALEPELQKYVQRAQSVAIPGSEKDRRAMEHVVMVLVTAATTAQPSSTSSSDTTTTPTSSYNLVAKMRLQDRMRALREAWFARSSRYLDEHYGLTAADVVLSWRGQRLYDSNTLYGLGIRPVDDDLTPDRDVRLRHVDDDDDHNNLNNLNNPGRFARRPNSTLGFVRARTQVHLEAWTKDLWDAHQQRKRLHHHRTDHHDSATITIPDDDDHDNDNDGTRAAAAVRKIAVTLLPKNLSPVELRVAAATTTMATLAAAFCRQRDVHPDTAVALFFDGVRLPANSTLDGAEIEDGDTIEVRFL